MTGWVFTYGVDGFGADIAPAHEEGIYLNFDKAFKRLCELNKEMINEKLFYEEGYGEDFYPNNDIELRRAEKLEDWKLFDKLMEKHRLTNLEKICKKYCVNEEPIYNYYAIEEIEIIE